MKSFISYIIESEQNFSTTVALVGGSFKPPHAGHFAMVQEYVKKANKVVVLISDPKSAKLIRTTNLGTVITPEMALKIWEVYIERYNLQGKVDVAISPDPSPIGALYKYIDEHLKDVNVIFGVSTKGDDYKRFLSAPKYYADNEHIHVLDPKENAVRPFENGGKAISATDIRNNIDKPDVIKTMLPSKLTDADIQKIIQILSDGKRINDSLEETETEEVDMLAPTNETECINLLINDDLLKNAKLLAYNIGQTVPNEKGKEEPVNPKKFPTKAVDIVFPVNNLLVEVFLDTESKKWDSKFKYNGKFCKLSPEQFGQFFGTNFYTRLIGAFKKKWPLTDEFYNGLYEGICNKEMLVGNSGTIDEASDEKDKDAYGSGHDVDKPRYSGSGRKLMNFSDIGVKGSSAKFHCWPNPDKNTDNVFRWSVWKDWKKIKPLCRMRFTYSNGHDYGISISCIGERYEHRGFRSYDLTEEPPLQWLSKDENANLMKLSIFNKFIKHCIERIQHYIHMDPEEIYAKINNPDKITIDEIRQTQDKVGKTLRYIIKTKQSDDFKWN